MKTLSDQLASIGAPVNNQRLVLRLCGGLTEAYNSVAPLIEHNNPLPPFDQARSMLLLAEQNMANRAAADDESALLSVAQPTDGSGSSSSTHNRGTNGPSAYKTKGGGGGGHRGGGGKGRHGSGGRGKGRQSGDRGFPSNPQHGSPSSTSWHHSRLVRLGLAAALGHPTVPLSHSEHLASH